MSDQKANGDTYEMLWDCRYCGSQGLLGLTHRFCPSCGAPQQADGRYFPSDEQKVAVKDHRYTGADRICPACATPNGAAAEFCQQCGAPLSTAAKVKLAERESRDEGRGFGASQPIRRQTHDASPPSSARRPRPGKPLWIALGLVGLLLIIGLVFLFWRVEVKAQVEDLSWRNQIQVERFQRVTQSDWCDAHPGDAYDISRSREIRSYRKVPDGESCRTVRVDQGDGTYRERRECTTQYRKEPIYADKCHYSVNRWRPARALVATGQDRSPRWPDTSGLRRGQCLGCERLGARDSKYFVELTDQQGRRDRCAVDGPVWRRLERGATIRVERRVMDKGIVCGSIGG